MQNLESLLPAILSRVFFISIIVRSFPSHGSLGSGGPHVLGCLYLQVGFPFSTGAGPEILFICAGLGTKTIKIYLVLFYQPCTVFQDIVLCSFGTLPHSGLDSCYLLSAQGWRRIGEGSLLAIRAEPESLATWLYAVSLMPAFCKAGRDVGQNIDLSYQGAGLEALSVSTGSGIGASVLGLSCSETGTDLQGRAMSSLCCPPPLRLKSSCCLRLGEKRWRRSLGYPG